MHFSTRADMEQLDILENNSGQISREVKPGILAKPIFNFHFNQNDMMVDYQDLGHSIIAVSQGYDEARSTVRIGKGWWK